MASWSLGAGWGRVATHADKNGATARIACDTQTGRSEILFRTAFMTVQPMMSLSIAMIPRKAIRQQSIPLFFVLLACGCASPRKTTIRTEYLLAARYDAGAKRVEGAASPQHSPVDDLQKFKALGFNTVVFDYVGDGERETLLNLAANCGLRAYLTDPAIHYYLLTGKLRASANLAALIAARVGTVKSHPAYAGVAVLSGYPSDRVAEVFAELDRAGIAYLYPGQSGYAAGGGAAVAWLDADEKSVAGISQVERLLLELNGEIFAGWNDGLVIDFSPPAQSAREQASARPSDESKAAGDIADAEESLPVAGPRARMFAVESLLRRGSMWGARLRSFARQSVPLAPDEVPTSSAIFTKGARRYVFVLNPSSQPARGAVRFPAVFGGVLIHRAVGVPASADKIAGEVFEARGGELTIQINLRAGDAALFELF